MEYELSFCRHVKGLTYRGKKWLWPQVRRPRRQFWEWTERGWREIR